MCFNNTVECFNNTEVCFNNTVVCSNNTVVCFNNTVVYPNSYIGEYNVRSMWLVTALSCWTNKLLSITIYQGLLNLLTYYLASNA